MSGFSVTERDLTELIDRIPVTQGGVWILIENVWVALPQLCALLDFAWGLF